MALARYKTAGELVNDVAKKVGIIQADLADPFSSTDPDIVRLCQLLSETGQELAESYEWNHLSVEQTYVGDGVTDTYNLPADFLQMVPQSGWNRTTQYALAGGLNVQVWQYRKAVPVNGIYAEFRLDTNVIRFIPAIPNAETVAFEYQSRSWVRPAASGLGNGNSLGTAGGDEPVATGDFVLFDPLLMLRALTLAWREDNGFNTTRAQAAFQRSLDRAQERVSSAPVLPLSPRSGGGDPDLVDIYHNLPDGNWNV